MVENAFTGKNKNTKSSFEVGLCWGHDRFGLEKIIAKHIEKQSDFDSVENAMKSVQKTFENGEWKRQKSTGRLIVKNGKITIILEKQDNRNLLLTVFDNSRNEDEKKRR